MQKQPKIYTHEQLNLKLFVQVVDFPPPFRIYSMLSYSKYPPCVFHAVASHILSSPHYLAACQPPLPAPFCRWCSHLTAFHSLRPPFSQCSSLCDITDLHDLFSPLVWQIWRAERSLVDMQKNRQWMELIEERGIKRWWCVGGRTVVRFIQEFVYLSV